MSKKRHKKGDCKKHSTTEYILLTIAILQLIQAVVELITELLE